MMEEKEISNEESLRLINRMIYEAKGYFYESGFGALIYGFSILICALLSYLLDIDKISFPFHPFYLFVPVFFIQAYIQIKEKKKKQKLLQTKPLILYGQVISFPICSFVRKLRRCRLHYDYNHFNSQGFASFLRA